MDTTPRFLSPRGADEEAFLRLMKPHLRHDLLDRKAEIDAIVRAKTDSKEALEFLLAHNYRIILLSASKYREWGQRRGRTIADLFDIALIAFITAIKKFDVTRGTRLSTYAGYWMGAALHGTLKRHSRIIHIPAKADEGISATIKAHDDFVARHGREPEEEELVAAVMTRIKKQRGKRYEGLKKQARSRDTEAPTAPKPVTRAEALQKITEYRVRLEEPTSMSVPIDDGVTTFGDMLTSGDPAESVAEGIETESVAQRIQDAIAQLTPVQQEILRLRFFNEREGKDDYTLKEAGELIPAHLFPNGGNVSRERVRQLQSMAFDKLRTALNDIGPA